MFEFFRRHTRALQVVLFLLVFPSFVFFGIQGYSGMAFVYGEDVQNSFYMRNTPTPLSIAWISADGEVVDTADMAPCEDRDDCPLYTPDGLYRYAIEVPQGRLENLGITEGSQVTVGGSCAPKT